MIKIGDKLPDGKFTLIGKDGPETKNAAEVFDGKKIVVFGLPGAFTPTCSGNHLPGFIENYDAIKAKGVDDIVCLAVNDMWVMHAWARHTATKYGSNTEKILFLADGNADFAKACGLDVDLSAVGFGTRMIRSAMIVEDRTVKMINTDTKPGVVELSGAAAVLEAL